MKVLKIILINIFFLIFGCIPFDRVNRIKIKNNLNVSVGCFLCETYPDTLLPKLQPFLYNISSHEQKSIDIEGNYYSYFRKLPKDTLSIFIICKDTLEKYQWENLREKYLILKRYDFSYDDLEMRDWTITYP